MSRLNPCPKCGGGPCVNADVDSFNVYCKRCFDVTMIKARSEVGAVNAWNAATNGEQASPTEKTLRDEFAMAALTGLQSVCWEDKCSTREKLIGRMTGVAYEIADSMLKERNK